MAGVQGGYPQARPVQGADVPGGHPQAQPIQGAGVPGGYTQAQPVQGAGAPGSYPHAQAVQGAYSAQGGAYPAGVPVYTQPTEWQAGFCDWYKDFDTCIITFCCPCITFGQYAEVVTNGQTSCIIAAALFVVITALTSWAVGPLVTILYTCGFRTKLREKYNLPSSPAPDCLVHACCLCCAIVQEYRELKLRGMDPAKGYQGNTVAQQVPMQQYMKR